MSASQKAIRTLIVAALAGAGALAPAAAERPEIRIPPPAVPEGLEVPEGHRAYLITRAYGTQNYVCLPGSSPTGLVWSFLGPQATAFDPRAVQVLTHFLSENPDEPGVARPTWQHSRDTSAVWAKPIASSTDPDFVEPGAVAWLLLEVVGAEPGPNGGEKLTPTRYLQRVRTLGGQAPASSCAVLGAKALVPYEADYVFYRAH